MKILGEELRDRIIHPSNISNSLPGDTIPIRANIFRHVSKLNTETSICMRKPMRLKEKDLINSSLPEKLNKLNKDFAKIT